MIKQFFKMFSGLRVFIFFFLPCYWIYLILNTQPVMIFDAIGYEAAGRLILEKGLGVYWQGLNREPLFPAMIALAMGVEKVTAIAYPLVLKAFLFISLGFTVFGIYRLSRLMGAGRWIAGAAAFYTGLSPAILNSCLWLWSEGAALPWGVWGVFFSIKAWHAAAGRKVRRTVLWSSAALICFIALLMVKAAVSVVGVLFSVPFAIAGVVYLVRRDFARAFAYLMAVLIIGGCFGGVVEGYKYLNFRINGNYALTNRIDLSLFGNTVRRLQPLTHDRLVQAVLSVPRLGLCEKYYGNAACVYWTYKRSDEIIDLAVQACSKQKFSDEQCRNYLTKGSFQWMAWHPFQQMALSALEAVKMLFWENRAYFVRYPEWIARMYGCNIIIFTLCFGWAALSLAGLGFAFFRCRVEFFLPAFFTALFMMVYAIFFIDMRYALPVAPLFISLTAGMFGSFIRNCFSSRADV